MDIDNATHLIRITRKIIGVILLVFIINPIIAYCQTQEDVPILAGIVINKANRLIQSQKYDQAIEQLETFAQKGKTLKKGEHDAKGYTHYLVDFALANAYLLKGAIDRAAMYYQNALKKNPQYSPAWLNLAKCHYDRNQFEAAAQAFLKGYQTQKSKTASPLYYAAVCYLSINDYAKSLAVFETLLEKHRPDIKLTWKESLISVYFNLNQPQKALPYVEELAEKTTGQKQITWQEILLYQYIQLKMNQKAKDFATFLTLNWPTNSKWWKAKAYLMLTNENYEEALADLTIYGFLKPFDLEESNLMGDLNLTVGLPGQAALFYKKVIEKESPEKPDIEIIKKIVQSLINLHQPQKALEWIDKGLQIDPNSDLVTLKANILFELARFKEAFEVFYRIAKGPKPNGRMWLMAGYAAWNAKDRDNAVSAFEQACKFAKSKKEARNALAQLKIMVMP